MREPFFEEAKKLFDGMLLILVTTSDNTVKSRLEKRAREEEHMVGHGMYLSFKKAWEPFERVDYHFVNEGDFEGNIRRCVLFLRKKLNDTHL